MSDLYEASDVTLEDWVFSFLDHVAHFATITPSKHKDMLTHATDILCLLTSNNVERVAGYVESWTVQYVKGFR